MRHNQTRTAWLLLLPMLLVMCTVAAWPLLRTAQTSLTDKPLVPVMDVFMVQDKTPQLFDLRHPAKDVTVLINNQPTDDYHINGAVLDLRPLGDQLMTGDQIIVSYAPNFVGLDNYRAVLLDQGWWRAMRNTLLFAGVSVSVSMVFGLGFALLLQRAMRGELWLRAAILIPYAMPTVVAAKIWQWMYHDQFGVINAVLGQLGGTAMPIAWLADPQLALWAIVVVDVWKSTPFIALLLLAGLYMLPRHVYEAARLDGINTWQQFWHITLPLLMPAILVALLFRLLDALRVFDLIYVLSSNSRDTMSLSVYIRQQMVDFGAMGHGAAAAMLFLSLIGLFTLVYMWVVKARAAR